MPGLNRRGPNSEGPMTGRKMGRCNPDNKGKSESEIFEGRPQPEESQDFYPGKNLRRGLGLRRGWKRGYGRGMGLGSGRNH